ncbi:Bug family tripartite tricarboxylate transporter substrate binding protein [Candidatus Palauibacter sp.]|uniref:Bug family tripartite tricarboxylate transporter substrate binding protein n=1 Tax=Candidatus Palauibacter sp. TaxID=3101350 RepID=UPI003B5B4B6F
MDTKGWSRRSFGRQPPVGFAAFGLAALALAGCSSSGGEAAFPSRAIEIVSWATPGGPTDLLSRALAEAAPPHFDGRRVTVMTRQGGAGAAGMQYLQGREGDPHVLGVFTASGTVNMATGRIPFSPGDFTPILRIQIDPFLVAVRDDSPFHTLGDLFEAAHARPGEVSVSGFGAASAHFLGFARLRAAAGDPDVRWIAYEGSADAVVAALGGHTDAAHTNYNIVREHLRAGTMRVLGVALPVEALPDTPSYAEQGYDLTPVHWRGVVGPPGLDPALRADLRARLMAAIEDPGFREYMERAALEYATMADADAFGVWMAEEVATSRDMLRRLGILDE